MARPGLPAADDDDLAPLRGGAAVAAVSGHVEAEHHAALVVLGDVAVGHPAPGVGDVEQDVDGLAGADEHGVLPDQVRLRRRRRG